jgi:lysophospholipase L1-like esterase
LCLGSVSVAFLLGESLVRWFKPQVLQWDTAAVWEPADGVKWRHRKNVDVWVNTGERPARILTDALGHRVGPTASGPGQIRILAVGDSMLEAVQVNYEQTMTALLERSLTTRLGQQVEVVNAGVGGYDPNQYLSTVRAELQQSAYDMVLVFVYVDNDIIGERVASYPATTNLVASSFRRRIESWLARRSHLFVFSRNLMWLPQMRSGARRHLLSNAMTTNRAMADWEVTADILQEIGVAAAGAPVAYVLLPAVQYVEPGLLYQLRLALGVDPTELDLAQPGERLGAALEARGLELVDATRTMQEAFNAGERNLYGRIDWHFAPAGHQVMARFLEPVVMNRLAVAGAPR